MGTFMRDNLRERPRTGKGAAFGKPSPRGRGVLRLCAVGVIAFVLSSTSSLSSARKIGDVSQNHSDVSAKSSLRSSREIGDVSQNRSEVSPKSKLAPACENGDLMALSKLAPAREKGGTSEGSGEPPAASPPAPSPTLPWVPESMALENKAFLGGERLDYKLYFNWKFIWIGAGTASMTINDATYKGQEAYKAYLQTATSKRIDRYFCMRDTLTSIVTRTLIPLYYRKGANEGGKYRLNEAEYSYPAEGKCDVSLLYVNPEGVRNEQIIEKEGEVFDMLSMMLRARSFNGDDYNVGDRILFEMADGHKVEQQTLVYRGKKNFKSEEQEGITYRCLVFSFVEKKGKKENEVVTFYVTDDLNHIPVRLDLFLRFGVAKAFLSSAKGVRWPLTSIVKRKKE